MKSEKRSTMIKMRTFPSLRLKLEEMAQKSGKTLSRTIEDLLKKSVG
jgi:hypothetical protein